MDTIKVNPIGRLVKTEESLYLELKPEYRAGLLGLEGFRHVQVLWWADGCDNDRDRSVLTEKKPYKKGPEELGVFAMRSPERPNPIALSTVEIAWVDVEAGRVGLYYIDAFPGSRVLDLKPYTPGIDRIEHPGTPDWCRHWPQSYEESGSFDWASEFNF